jgi:hypothetical protein
MIPPAVAPMTPASISRALRASAHYHGPLLESTELFLDYSLALAGEPFPVKDIRK